MKIAIDARMIESSGIGTYVRACLKSGLYSVALGNADTIHKYFPNITVIHFEEKIYSIKEQLKFPKKALKREHVELLHIPHYNIPIFYHGKIVATMHDLTHLYFPQFLPNRKALFYAKFMLKRAAKKSLQVLTVSQFVKEEIKTRFKVADSKIDVVYSVCTGDFKVKEKNETAYLYNRFSIPQNKKIILYVGNFKPHKNISALVSAYQQTKVVDNAVLVLAGKEFDCPNELWKDLPHGKVIRAGEVSHQELIDLYNIADIFVLPSLSEGFGVPPLEAMACGTPVACSDVTSLPEIVGDAAITFNPYKTEEIVAAIDNILTDNTLANNLISKGFERVKLFTEENLIKSLKEVFQKDADLFANNKR